MPNTAEKPGPASDQESFRVPYAVTSFLLAMWHLAVGGPILLVDVILGSVDVSIPLYSLSARFINVGMVLPLVAAGTGVLRGARWAEILTYVLGLTAALSAFLTWRSETVLFISGMLNGIYSLIVLAFASWVATARSPLRREPTSRKNGA